jgi:hypothetical protein
MSPFLSVVAPSVFFLVIGTILFVVLPLIATHVFQSPRSYVALCREFIVFATFLGILAITLHTYFPKGPFVLIGLILLAFIIAFFSVYRLKRRLTQERNLDHD